MPEETKSMKIRKFLIDNEIFFKTITSTVISLAAITVTALQYGIAASQLRIADFQKQLAQAGSLPLFDIKIIQEMNDESKKYDDNKMIVINSGGVAKEYKSTPMYFIEISATEKSIYVSGGRTLPYIDSKEEIIPLNGYYTAAAVSGISRGTLETIHGFRNNKKRAEIERQLIEKGKSAGLITLNLRERHILKISYKDILGEHHTEYYEAQTVGPPFTLSDQSASEYEKSGQKYQEKK